MRFKKRMLMVLIGVVLLGGLVLLSIGLTPVQAAGTITVNTTADTTTGGDGLCTLREAIANANGNSDTTSGDCAAGSGTDTILFSIGAVGSQQTITLTSNLPSISDPVVLDGWSQGGAGYTGPPLIELDGSNLASSSIAGFRITAGSSTVRGFIIHSFDDASNSAIWLHTAHGNWIYGNYIGVNAGGTTALPNYYGIWINNRGNTQPSNNNIIGTNGDGVNDAFEGNVIAGSIQEDVRVETSGNWIAGNFIGTNAAGSAALTNTNTGIRLYGGADNTTIGVNGDGTSDGLEGNLISGHNFGIGINNSSGHTIAGNIIGLDATGSVILGNSSNGIDCSASSGSTSRDIIIGSNNDGISDDLEGNVISGNGSRGYSTFDNGCRHITLSRNKIGTTITGTAALGNGAEGIIISAGDWYTITHNFISGNGTNGTADGVLSGNGANNITLANNTIGSDINGTANLGNTGDGIEISFSDNQTVRRNQISGNGSSGILVSGSDSALIENNLIGVQADGNSALGNGNDGVYISGDAKNNTVFSNTIFYNGRNGIIVDSPQAISNTLSANRVFSNTGLGIDLDFDGLTANDATDSDSGPNNLQNYPVIAAVDSSGGVLTVTGTLTSTANTAFTLEFFANSVCDASGFGEGESYLGADTVTTNGSGRVDFVSAISAPGVEGQFLTATATGPGGNTSEFSGCFTEPIGFDPLSGLQAANDSPTILGFTTHFTASVSTGSNISYAWDFGDGSNGAGATTSHVYASPGNYTAIVTATNAWTSLTASTPVTITAAPACAATPDDGATLFYSSDATAVQQAIDHPASSGGLIKVAGTCAGVAARTGVTQSVYISQSLTVQGGYSYLNWSTSQPLSQPTVLDGQSAGRVFYITGTLPVTLEHLIVQRGLVSTNTFSCPAGCGGAILSHGPLTMTGLTIQNNQATRGGAAYLLAPAAIDNSDWLSNTARGRGGALYNRDSIQINSSNFVGNTGSYGGGIVSESAGSLTVEQSTFRQNLAESGGVGGGGAIYAAVAATVSHSLIEDNRSFFNGGGLTAIDDLTIFQTDFVSNTAAEAGGGLLSLGVTHIENSRFERNSAQSSNGGGLYLSRGAFITATQIVTNSADQAGGGLYQPQSSPSTDTIRLTNVTLQGNQALNQHGGGAYIGENLVMANSTVAGNTAEFGDGGGLNIGNSGLIQNSTLRQNQAEQGGGAYAEGPLTVENSDWLTNTATNLSGGALHARYTTVISDSTFAGNSGSFGGGLAAVGGGNPPDAPIDATITLTVENASFRQNTATSFLIGGGGGVRVAVPATISHSLFEANRSSLNGGGLAATNPVTLTHTDFVSNTANEGGGLLSLALTRIDHGRFERNSASVDGGGLALHSRAVLTATRFLTNTAGNDGGGLYQSAISPFMDNVTLVSVTVQGNQTQQDGGGAYIGETLVMTNSQVRNNASLAVNGLGGGLAVGGSFDIRRSTIAGNQANGSGGGLALTTNADSATPASQIINTLLAGNQAEADKNNPSGQNGAGLFLDKGPATVLHTTIANPSQVTGQAIYANGGTEVITVQNTIMASYTTGLAHEFSTPVNSRHNLYFGATLTETTGINSANAVVGNPLFADPGAGDYHLLLGSAAIEAGVAASVAEDFEGDPRPIGSLVDIGFDEFGDGALLGGGTSGQLQSRFSPNRQVTANIPGGALNTQALVTLSPAAAPNPPITGTRRFVNVAFTLQSFTTNLNALDTSLTFSQPVTIVVEYGDEDVADVDEDSLRLDILDESSGTWDDATNTCTPQGNIIREPDSNRLSAEVCTTGQFALTAGSSGVSVYLPVILRE